MRRGWMFPHLEDHRPCSGPLEVVQLPFLGFKARSCLYKAQQRHLIHGSSITGRRSGGRVPDAPERVRQADALARVGR